MENGEKDIQELRKAIAEQKESHDKAIEERKRSQDALEVRLETKDSQRQQLDRDIYERLGSMKTMQSVQAWIMGAILTAIVGLAFVALHK